jgi:hypothetical protein
MVDFDLKKTKNDSKLRNFDPKLSKIDKFNPETPKSSIPAS